MTALWLILAFLAGAGCGVVLMAILAAGGQEIPRPPDGPPAA